MLGLFTKFISCNKETEGRRPDARPPFTQARDAFWLEFWNSPEARRAEVLSAGAGSDSGPPGQVRDYRFRTLVLFCTVL